MVTTTIHRTHDTNDTNDGDFETPGRDVRLWSPDNDAYTTKYVYHDEEGLHVGTLRDYARAWEEATTFGYYLSKEVRTWYTTHPVTVTYLGTDDEHYMHYRLTANDETVYAVTDGRV